LAAERVLYPARFKAEKDLREKYDVTEAQLAWRWRTMKEDCGNDPDKFAQEYPSDPKSCFLGSGRQRFNQDGLTAWGDLAKKYPGEIGVLSAPMAMHSMATPRPTFARTSHGEAWMQQWEQPGIGKSYLVTVDPMRGAEQTQGTKKEPDCHAVGVLRQGYRDSRTGVWYRPRLVARILPPCRVDLDVLAVMVAALSRYYGNCNVVVESNAHGLALLELLKLMPDIPLYRQKLFNRLDSTTTERLGFQNVDHREAGQLAGIRTAIIEGLATVIREYANPVGGLEVCCPHCVEECTTFVVDGNGRAAAMEGYHDDDVLMLAIGLYCLGEATMYPETVVERRLPEDLRQQLDGEMAWQGNGQYR
jgi:hypothetical protein